MSARRGRWRHDQVHPRRGLTQHVEAGRIRFAYRRRGVSERLPLVFFQHVMGTLDDHDPALSDPALSVRHARVFLDD